MKERNAKIQRSLNKKAIAFVKRFSRTVSEKLLAYHYANQIESNEIVLEN